MGAGQSKSQTPNIKELPDQAQPSALSSCKMDDTVLAGMTQKERNAAKVIYLDGKCISLDELLAQETLLSEKEKAAMCLSNRGHAWFNGKACLHVEGNEIQQMRVIQDVAASGGIPPVPAEDDTPDNGSADETPLEDPSANNPGSEMQNAAGNVGNGDDVGAETFVSFPRQDASLLPLLIMVALLLAVLYRCRN